MEQNSTNPKSENIARRKELAKYLRYGDKKRIAASAGVGVNVVSRYFNGTYNNSIVEMYVEEVIKERRAHASRMAHSIVNS